MAGQDSTRTGPGRVLISGGASGLGAAVATRVTEAGGQALVLDKQAPAAPVAGFRTVDVTDTDEVTAAVRELAADGLDAVVTAAGTDACGPLGGISAADWERVVRVNLFGTAAVVRAALPALERSHGRVVTVASTLGLRPAGDATAYCASKFGVVGFTRALAMETAGRVGVTLLVPGGMRTHFFDDRPDQYKPRDDSALNDPLLVADSVLHALASPPGCEVRELLVCTDLEPSWP
ncbi:SDR family oxidoreductase [Actinokineospora bangkokensis]|uniref:Short-chain dehydrogenase n=1 Tax=Actinokineospora bangkokensis TaxID=1193682 RepID=A0A1Q9LLN1_9PSEU|nr:SDR family oxidoreductase [Actinokineospora bangkokensis]OLR92946.1 short-chain dehydrogenase [Actinokineospora bangkokensis]